MGEVNGSPSKKNILFSIGSYKEKKKVNRILADELFSGVLSNSVSPSPKAAAPKARPISLDVTDAPLFKSIAQQPSRNFNFHNGKLDLAVEKPACPSSPARDCPLPLDTFDKPQHPPQFHKKYDRSVSLEPEQLRQSGKVALTIAAYEGEVRTPSRLDFLPSPTSSTRRVSRTSSKASDASTPLEDYDESINSRLQNELVATLKRSNLKKKLENGEANESKSEEKSPTEESKEVVEMTNGNVKKLATVLDKTLTFKH